GEQHETQHHIKPHSVLERAVKVDALHVPWRVEWYSTMTGFPGMNLVKTWEANPVPPTDSG
ncbi:hypothetical protein ACQP3J_33460, partial [Escherichia coli]